MSKPYSIESHEAICNQLVAQQARGRPCSEYVESVGGEVRVGDFMKFRRVTCKPPLPDTETPLAISFVVLSSLAQGMGFFENEAGYMCCNTNLYVRLNRFPSRVTFQGIVKVPKRVLFAQTNVTVHLHLCDVMAVALVLHRTLFTEDNNGFMNVYAV
jgi:hypothetical protein